MAYADESLANVAQVRHHVLYADDGEESTVTNMSLESLENIPNFLPGIGGINNRGISYGIGLHQSFAVMPGHRRVVYFSLTEPEIHVNTQSIKAEAQEEGFDIPTDAVLESAKFVSSKLPEFGVSESEVEIYPMPDGGVAVDVFRGPEGDRSSIIFLCGETDGLQCLVHVKNNNYALEISRKIFPDDDVRKAFTRLMEVS